MPYRLRSRALLVLSLSLPAALAAEGPDPAALRREIEGSRLELAEAVAVKGVKLQAGLATLSLDDGILMPASPVGGKRVEMVFLGTGRLAIDPPDAVEAGQMELFTGAARLDEELREAVLVVGLDAAAEALLGRPRVASLEPGLARRAEDVYSRWRASPERKLLHVEGGILLDAAGDPLYQGYFAGWFRGSEQGDFLYLIEPDSPEQVTLGRFVPLDATEKEKRKILKLLDREQRRGRLIGLELDDLGQWDTWLSASLTGKDGKPTPGAAAFEPELYTLEVKLAERDLALSARARIDLRPVVPGSRAVTLRLQGDLEVQRVTDGAGADLFFHRSGADLIVLLPRPPAEGEPVALVVEYRGNLIDKAGRARALRDTQDWYPHAGVLDRARYDVTFRWPRKLELLACGRRVDGGESADGMRWERRVLGVPVGNVAFEVGRFKVETARAGHVEVKLAFDPESGLDRAARQEILEAVTGSLTYFEEIFGPYPLDELTVATVPRGFSQAMLGLVTLSSLMMTDLGVWNLILGLEDRRTVIAHEVAHQWWGHLVGWQSYRDQWISEAMANYAALLYGKHRLGRQYLVGPTTGWQEALTSTTADGRPIESLGPVVLGQRLLSSRSAAAYQSIVYQKGALVLNMLAHSLGEENFPKVLRQVIKAASSKAISTGDLLSLIERVTTADLDWFATQYVYGTGLPEVYYSYRFERKADGKWAVAGKARQQAPYRFRYRVVAGPGGALDVAREALDQIAVASSALVVPLEIDLYDPARPPAEGTEGGKKGKKGEPAVNARLRASVLIRGETSDLALDLDQEPRSLWLDRHREVFGRFYDESRNPKRMLFYQGIDAAAAGKPEAAQALYSRALAAEVAAEEPDGASDRRDTRAEGRQLDAMIELGLARLHLDQGRDAEARAALERAHKVLGSHQGWVREELKVLESRLDIRRGDCDRAFKRLRKGVLKGGGLDSTESYVLLAIAAKATGHGEELRRALEEARENGADVALLAP